MTNEAAPQRPLEMKKGWVHKPCGGPVEADPEWGVFACWRCGANGQMKAVPSSECERAG